MVSNGDASKMTEAWSAAQKQLWDTWLEMLQSAPTAGPAQWQKLAEQSMTAWMTDANPTAKQAAAQLLASQQIMLNFLDYATKLWQETAANLPADGDWSAAIQQATGEMQKQFQANTAKWAEHATKSMGLPGTFWQTMQQQAQAVGQPWLNAWQQAGAAFMPGTGMPGAGLPQMSTFGDVTGQMFNAYQQTFGQFLDTPPLGYAREYEEKVRQFVKAGQELVEAGVEYQSVMSDAWVNGMTKLMEALARRAQEGRPIRTIQELSDEWANIADPAFYEIFISEKFVRTQGKLLSATMRHRIAQRKLTEAAAEAMDMPTRTEVDAAHQSIAHQRREIRALKRALTDATGKIAALEAAQAALQKAAAAPAKKTPAAKKPAAKRTTGATTRAANASAQADKKGKA